MVKEKYTSLQDFQSKTDFDRMIKTNEGIVCKTSEFVYKIFDYSNLGEYYAKMKNIKKLASLSEDMFTVPCSLIYIDGYFAGFKMHNLGEALLDKILADELTIEDKKLIANGLKDISLYLKKKRLVHLDINLKNILYLDGNVRLADINGMLKIPYVFPFKNQYIRTLELYYHWLLKYGVALIDYLEINFCTHILFNCDTNHLLELFKKANNRTQTSYMYYELLDVGNTSFDDDAFAYFEEAFNQKRIKLEPNTYLIDYLK